VGKEVEDSENVAIVGRLYECFRSRDNETPFAFYADDIVWDARGVHLPGLDQIYHGHDGVRTFWRQWLEAWEEIEFEMDGPTELEDGRVQVQVRQRNRGHGTGIWVEQDPYNHFWTLSDGKVTKLEFSWADRA
jgi:ketosteroid isomerase-like protein